MPRNGGNLPNYLLKPVRHQTGATVVQARAVGDEEKIEDLKTLIKGDPGRLMHWTAKNYRGRDLALVMAVEENKPEIVRQVGASGVEPQTLKEALDTLMSRRGSLERHALIDPLLASAPALPLPREIPAAARLLQWAGFPKQAEACTDLTIGIRERSEFYRLNRENISNGPTLLALGGAVLSMWSGVIEGVAHNASAGAKATLVGVGVSAAVSAGLYASNLAAIARREGKISRLSRTLGP